MSPLSAPSPLRLLVIADVGGDETRHIGDEAMLEANLDGFRARIPGVAFTVVSRDPEWTAARHGVDGVALLGFPRDPSAGDERRAMLDRLLSQASGHSSDPHPPFPPCASALAAADALVVSGGGNLSSTWPDLLYERVALLELARIFHKPAVVLGQTLGPRLADQERLLLSHALASARFVGLRELPSAALALELGVPAERIVYQVDDALIAREGPEALPAAREPAIAVTIDPQLRATDPSNFDSLAAQLCALSEQTGAGLTLVPHAFGGESSGAPSDLTEARLLAERIGLAQTVVAAGLDAGQVRSITGRAAMVISSRYHPIVFGLGEGVPCLGIYGDEYCRIKLQGALAHAGLERWTLPYHDLAQGMLLVQALELWRMRDEVRLTLESRHGAWDEESRERWDAIVRALDPDYELPPAGRLTLFGRPVEHIAPSLMSALEGRRQSWQREQASFERMAELRDQAKGIAYDLAKRLERAEGFARYLESESGLRRTARHLRAWLRSKT